MRNLRYIALLLLACFIALVLIFEPGLAASDKSYNDEENIDTSTIFVAEQGVYDYPYEIYPVNQGDKVFLQDHVDISRVAAGYMALAWFASGSPEEGEVAYIIDLPRHNYQYYNVYIDPEVFKKYPGDWYKWNGYVEPAGNMLAFTVKEYQRPSNVTVIQTINATIIKQQEENKSAKLPEKKIADYLTVHGQQLKIENDEAPYRVWIFGTKDRFYSLESEEYDFRLTKDEVDTLHSGKYTILIQSRGVNYNFDVSWNEGTEELGRTSKNPWEKSKIVEEAGIQPMMVLDDLKELLKETDDKYQTYSLEIQDPALQVMSMDFVEIRNARNYYNDISLRGNVSLYRVSGYTNVLPMTGLKFALDEDEQAKPEYFTGEAKGSDPGAMRQFLVDVPIYTDNMREGMHTISGYTAVGGSVFYDFPVNIAPEHSYIPSQDIKYVGDENPWKPNLTTRTITIPITVIQTITIPVTPPDEQVKAQQQIVQDEINRKNWERVYTIAVAVIFMVLAIVGGRYIYKVYRKARNQRERDRALKFEQDVGNNYEDEMMK